MVIKALFIVLAFCAYQGQGLEEVRLKDMNINIMKHDFMGPVLTLLTPTDDKLMACHITYPNGRTYEAFPQNKLPDSNLLFNEVKPPFNICSFTFVNASPNFSGTYDLASSTMSSVNNDVTTTRQRFNVRITEF